MSIARAFALVAALALSVSLLLSQPAEASISVNGSQINQTIDGFGVNINSASWKNGQLIPALDMLTNQLGATIFRVVIDNSDWENTNDNSDPNVFNETFYNNIYTSAKFEALWSTIAYLNQKGITQNVMISLMGPTANWMGGSHIDSNQEDEFVEMVASMVSYAKNSRGLQFGLISPLNEPDWDGIEGPNVDMWQYTTIMQKLGTKLDSIGMSSLQFVGPDTAQVGTCVNSYIPEMINNSVVMGKLAHFGCHNYAGDTGGALARVSPTGKNFWMTEVTNIWDELPELQQGASSILVWDAYDSVYNHAILAGRGSTPPNDAGNGPALLSYNGSTYSPRKAFYEHAQLFKYVTPGSRRIGSTGQSGVTILAFQHPSTGRLTIVGRNDNGETTMSGSISGLTAPASFQFYVTDTTQNMVQLSDVVVSGNSFTFTVTGYSTFTLTSGSSSPPPPPPPPDTTPPEEPTSVNATPLVPASSSDSQVRLTWTAPSVNVDGSPLTDLAGYNVLYGTAMGNYTVNRTVPNQTTYTLTGLVGGQTYYMVIKSRDTSGNLSEPSYPETSVTALVYTPPPPPPPEPFVGLVASYSFNEGAGSVLGDSSGNGNNGSVQGATWIAGGKFGNALLFNGLNDIVAIPDSELLDVDDVTLEAWVYPTELNGGTAGGWRSVILREQADGLVYALYANSNVKRPEGYINNGSDRGIRGTSQLKLNLWSHLAFTYNRSYMRFYVNGVLVRSKATSGLMPKVNGILTIGGNTIWGEYFKGVIDEVRVYNRALTVQEIQTDMNAAVQ